MSSVIWSSTGSTYQPEWVKVHKRGGEERERDVRLGDGGGRRRVERVEARRRPAHQVPDRPEDGHAGRGEEALEQEVAARAALVSVGKRVHPRGPQVVQVHVEALVVRVLVVRHDVLRRAVEGEAGGRRRVCACVWEGGRKSKSCARRRRLCVCRAVGRESDRCARQEGEAERSIHGRVTHPRGTARTARSLTASRAARVPVAAAAAVAACWLRCNALWA